MTTWIFSIPPCILNEIIFLFCHRTCGKSRHIQDIGILRLVCRHFLQIVEDLLYPTIGEDFPSIDGLHLKDYVTGRNRLHWPIKINSVHGVNIFTPSDLKDLCRYFPQNLKKLQILRFIEDPTFSYTNQLLIALKPKMEQLTTFEIKTGVNFPLLEIVPKKIENLTIGYMQNGSDHFTLNDISAFTQLKTFSLLHGYITIAEWDSFLFPSSLQTLDVKSIQYATPTITNHIISVLCKLNHLTILILHSYDRSTFDIMKYFPNLQVLKLLGKYVDFDKSYTSSIQEDGAFSSLKKLHTLKIRSCNAIHLENQASQFFAQFSTSLKSLALNKLTIDEKFISILPTFLEELDLSESESIDFASLQFLSTRLTRLKIRKCQGNYSPIITLPRFLKYLDVSFSYIETFTYVPKTLQILDFTLFEEPYTNYVTFLGTHSKKNTILITCTLKHLESDIVKEVNFMEPFLRSWEEITEVFHIHDTIYRRSKFPSFMDKKLCFEKCY